MSSKIFLERLYVDGSIDAETIFEPVPAGQGYNTAPSIRKINDGLIPASRKAHDTR